ncbi:hypothetical protein [Methylomicrobium sp. Wu6]|uniref:hypothetical protein n=1 Tax=Methylomicrobium sp. Wu6 TaxID=3107928 RepID=UPI002DD63E47|nr:hypothetical protein [Methylomicrobium sp. Wu6]MEC4746896.1 hypothetical protein [Methylomicrobium sp. Wu6]
MQSTKLLICLFVRSVVWLAIMGYLLFLPANNWQWIQAWAFLAIFAVGSIAFSAWLWRRDPDLLATRLGPLMQHGQPLWDRIFLLTFVFIWCGWLVLMALDAEAWYTSNMPPLLNVIGGLSVIAGFAATLFVFRENSCKTAFNFFH